MFTEKDLRELLEFKTENQVLSVYLNTDPTLGSADAYRPRLRGMLKDIELKNDVQKIEAYIDFEFDWSGKGVALFSCTDEDFFRVYSFAVPLRDRARISDRPYVKPLAWVKSLRKKKLPVRVSATQKEAVAHKHLDVVGAPPDKQTTQKKLPIAILKNLLT